LREFEARSAVIWESKMGGQEEIGDEQEPENATNRGD